MVSNRACCRCPSSRRSGGGRQFLKVCSELPSALREVKPPGDKSVLTAVTLLTKRRKCSTSARATRSFPKSNSFRSRKSMRLGTLAQTGRQIPLRHRPGPAQVQPGRVMNKVFGSPTGSPASRGTQASPPGSFRGAESWRINFQERAASPAPPGCCPSIAPWSGSPI
jgi:hypothetical protein